MISDYFNFLKNLAKSQLYYKNFKVIREVSTPDKGFIRFVLTFIDDSQLHVFEDVN